MRSALTLILLSSSTLGCKGGTPTDTGPSAYVFKAASVPEAVEAEVSAATVDGWDATVGLLAMVDLVTTDTLVQDLMGSAAAPIPGCWTTFPVSSITLELDYAPCQAIQASGETRVARLAQATAVAIQPEPSFTYKGRRITVGDWVFTPYENSRWRTAGGVWADGTDAPTTTLTVDIDGRAVDATIAGRARYVSLSNQMSHWGTLQVTGDNGTQEVWYGATTVEEATGTAEPAAVLVDPLIDECRCANTGTISLPTALEATKVDLDLNRSLEDGGTIWPIITVETTATVPGVLQVRPGNQCGRLQGEFVPADGEELVITGAELQAGIDNACAANAFGDEVKCEQMRAAAADVSSHIVTLNERVNGAMVKELVERLMDPSFCE